MFTSTFSGRTCAVIPGVEVEVEVEEEIRSSFGESAGFSTSRGATCTSFTSVCPKAPRLTHPSAQRIRASRLHSRMEFPNVRFWRRKSEVGSQGRTGQPLRTKAIG